MKRLTLTLSLLPLLAAAQEAPPTVTAGQTEFFEARIRPVLANNCFACHTNSRMGGLRLDSREGLLKGGKSGTAVSPGDPSQSTLITAIRHSGDLKMPKGGTKLTDAQIADFTAWIKDGAYWPVEKQTSVAGKITAAQRRFWSIQPLANPQAPQPKTTNWAANELDRFVLAKLEEKGLKPAPAADKRTLIRRAYIDLTGLPPSYDEVKAFETDNSPEAFEKVIDRLLASPRYGERWGRHWLDVVRFGEEDYHIGGKPDNTIKYPNNYLFRDWVIKSLNDDLPYADFVRAQVAGDLIEGPKRAKLLPGVGMNGGGIWKLEANLAAIERADEWNDKVDVTTRAFLGLTVGCARCHDHKYDPIPTKDYYRLAGVFASTRFHVYPLVPKSIWDAHEAQKKTLEAKEKALKDFETKSAELYSQTYFAQTVDYMMAAYKLAKTRRVTADQIAAEAKLDQEILERWARFLRKPPSNYGFLKDWQAMMDDPKSTEDQARKLAQGFYEIAQETVKLREKVKEENDTALAKIKDPKDDEAYDPLPNGLKRKLTKYQIDLKGMDRERTYLYNDLFVYDVPANPGDDLAEGEKKPGLLKIEGWPLQKRLNTDFALHISQMKAGIESFKKSMPPTPPLLNGLEDTKEPVDLKIFVRGNPFSFGQEAPRAFLSMLSPDEPKPYVKGSGRLELADEIVSHPITARVIANRLWAWHMGSGIVATPSNFGMIGDKPTHPELLEHLASRFVAGGGSWKKFHKYLMLSRTYQLSSASNEANQAKDADNRFYWRANRRRLEAEAVWDNLLHASGSLRMMPMGGPSEPLEDGMTRRAVYGRISRMYPNAFLSTFDFPPPTISAERRYATNVPQQRLFFLNNPMVHKQAALIAKRLQAEPSPAAQVTRAYQIVLQRDPTAAELAAATELLKPAAGAATPDKAMPFSAKPAPSFAANNAGEHASASPLQSLCWALLSSNEFLYVN